MMINYDEMVVDHKIIWLFEILKREKQKRKKEKQPCAVTLRMNAYLKDLNVGRETMDQDCIPGDHHLRPIMRPTAIAEEISISFMSITMGKRKHLHF